MDKIPIVTAANERYFPGLVALYNSYKKHCSDDFEFYAMVQGDDALVSKVEGLGINVIGNPVIPARCFPVTKNRPVETAEVHFYRIMIPTLFEGYKKTIYIDSDSVILQSLKPLADKVYLQPIAATESNAPLSKEIEGLGSTHGFISSLMIFNHEQWFKQDILGQCVSAMNEPPAVFYTGDQSVLNWVLMDNWYKLPADCQPHAGHGTLYKNPIGRAYILHFLGTNPWEEIPAHLQPYPKHKLDARALWGAYGAGC